MISVTVVVGEERLERAVAEDVGRDLAHEPLAIVAAQRRAGRARARPSTACWTRSQVLVAVGRRRAPGRASRCTRAGRASSARRTGRATPVAARVHDSGSAASASAARARSRRAVALLAAASASPLSWSSRSIIALPSNAPRRRDWRKPAPFCGSAATARPRCARSARATPRSAQCLRELGIGSRERTTGLPRLTAGATTGSLGTSKRPAGRVPPRRRCAVRPTLGLDAVEHEIRTRRPGSRGARAFEAEPDVLERRHVEPAEQQKRSVGRARRASVP